MKKFDFLTAACLINKEKNSKNYKNYKNTIKPVIFELSGTLEEILEKQLNSTIAVFARHISDQNRTDFYNELKQFKNKYQLKIN